jgi:hypothetical protein
MKNTLITDFTPFDSRSTFKHVKIKLLYFTEHNEKSSITKQNIQHTRTHAHTHIHTFACPLTQAKNTFD